MSETGQDKRKRLTGLERAAQLRAAAEIIEARERDKADRKRTRKLIILGGAAIAEARENPAFREQLAQIVKVRVVKPIDVKDVEGWESIT